MLTRTKIKALEKKAVSRSNRLNGKPENQLNVSNNWLDFARKCKIRSGGNVVYFDPYQYQIDLVDLMINHSICCIKSRQLGISETITCFMLWRACLNPGYLGLVFSKTQTDSSLIARRMKRMIESLGLKTATENLTDIEINGGGRILFRNSNPDSARGIESVVDVFLDELAFLETAKEVYDSLAPSQQMVGDKARVFAVSTPNGKSGFYWDLLNSGNGNKDIELLCKNASDGNGEPFQHWIDSGGWGKVLIHWKSHPLYGGNPNFLNDIHDKQKLSWEIINQEYNLSFQESSCNYFSFADINKCAIGENEKYNDDYDFYLGIDSATTGKDYAVCVVLKRDKNTYSLVHLYRKSQNSTEYHLFNINNLIVEYKPKIVAIEVTGGVGQIWYEELLKVNKYTTFERIKTTGDSKPMMLDRLKMLIENGKFVYPANSPIIDELLNFKKNKNKLEAATNKHDDIIMSVSFALSCAMLEKPSMFKIL
jgi:phage terminase large subunit-like protein